MRKEHAQHNENVCHFLYDNSEYYDWVVTTAFYAVIHFARYKIFPLTKYDPHFDQSITYNSLENYVNNHNNATKNKHKELRKLVKEKLPSIFGRYKWLEDICYTSRYHNYNIPIEKAKLAKENLQRIKTFCCS
jgi:predicted negative regulator of RcsB-dependent stress response